MKNLVYSLLIIILAFFANSACTNYDHEQADTVANQKGFERHFGFPTPASVTDLYYYADELGIDVKYQMGFRADPETIQRIVVELDLVQQEVTIQSRIAQDFAW